MKVDEMWAEQIHAAGAVKIRDMLYSPCQGKDEYLRNVNNYNMIDNIHFIEHMYP